VCKIPFDGTAVSHFSEQEIVQNITEESVLQKGFRLLEDPVLKKYCGFSCKFCFERNSYE